MKELEKYERKYFNMIKNDKETLEKKKNDFITISINEINKALISEEDKKEVEEIIDYETGEIKEVENDSWGELNQMENFESLEDLKIENHKQEVEDDDISFLFTDAELESGIDRPDTKDNAIDVLKKFSPEEIEKLFG